MGEDLKWTCGKDTNLECVGCIGDGGYGIICQVSTFLVLHRPGSEVGFLDDPEKKLFRLRTRENTSSQGKVFARKLIRINFWVQEEDVESQIKALKSLYQGGRGDEISEGSLRDHIIEVLNHSWLPGYY